MVSIKLKNACFVKENVEFCFYISVLSACVEEEKKRETCNRFLCDPAAERAVGQTEGDRTARDRIFTWNLWLIGNAVKMMVSWLIWGVVLMETG